MRLFCILFGYRYRCKDTVADIDVNINTDTDIDMAASIDYGGPLKALQGISGFLLG